MKKDCFQLHITIPMVTNSSELMDFVESVSAFQLLQSQKPVSWSDVGKIHGWISFKDGPCRRDGNQTPTWVKGWLSEKRKYLKQMSGKQESCSGNSEKTASLKAKCEQFKDSYCWPKKCPNL